MQPRLADEIFTLNDLVLAIVEVSVHFHMRWLAR